MRSTTEFDAADYLDNGEARYWFLLEALEPPVSLRVFTGSIETVARSAGSVAALAHEAGVPIEAIEAGAQTTDLAVARATIHVLLDGLRRYVPASQLVA